MASLRTILPWMTTASTLGRHASNTASKALAANHDGLHLHAGVAPSMLIAPGAAVNGSVSLASTADFADGSTCTSSAFFQPPPVSQPPSVMLPPGRSRRLTGPNRIGHACHHDGDLARCPLRRRGGWRLVGDDDCDVEPNQFRGLLSKKIGLSLGAADLQPDAATLDVAGISESIAQPIQKGFERR